METRSRSLSNQINIIETSVASKMAEVLDRQKTGLRMIEQGNEQLKIRNETQISELRAVVDAVPQAYVCIYVYVCVCLLINNK